MIRINGISLPLDYDENTLLRAAAKALKVKTTDIRCVSVFRKSVDARKKNNVHFEVSVDAAVYGDENIIAGRCSKAAVAKEYVYEIPASKPLDKRPVIIGSGPCGLFAALILAYAGQKPLLFERGRNVDSRTSDVGRFSLTGILDTASNIQFGEGGAGTFSDGKLNTGTKDVRIRKILIEFAAHGAPEDILFLAKPHIGTDKLKTTVKNIREHIIALGGEVFFESKLEEIIQKDGRLTGIIISHKNDRKTIECDNVILAIGHSARDTFKMLFESGIAMEQKPFAMGVRIEHLQEQINKQQYGSFWNSRYLSAADYKLAVHLGDGRGVFTFCMCPGGTVVPAASEEGHLVTNGMSEFARDGINANSALLVGIGKDDIRSENVLAGVELQRKLESASFRLGGENYHAPVQRVADFLAGNASSELGSVKPTYRPGYELTSLNRCLPEFMTDSLKQGLLLMDSRLKGFADGDAVLTAVESRSSSPVRILRGEDMQSLSLKGLYPCGEGAGYAGGIMSAAVDGIKAAEMILRNH